MTEGKVNSVLGWWAKRLDRLHPTLKFPECSGLAQHMPMEIEEDKISFPVNMSRRLSRKSTPTDSENPELMLQSTAPGNGTHTASAGPAFEVGEHVVVKRRMTANVSLPGQHEFRRDLNVGAEAIIETLEDVDHPGKVEININIMQKEVAHEIKTWVMCQNLGRPGQSDVPPIECAVATGIAPGTRATADTPLAPLGSAPAYIVNGDAAFGVNVARVENVAELLDESSQHADIAVLKAQATVLMRVVKNLMPPLDEGLSVWHRTNKSGSRRTEIWTERDFEAGDLKFAPWSLEIKDRLYTHRASVSLGLEQQYRPNNRVMALDGRNRGHLFHGDQHSKAESGNLFWVIKRTQNREEANLCLEHVSVKVEFNVTLPQPAGRSVAQKVKMGDGWPMVPILTNKKAVTAHTMLVALEDPVMCQLREDEIKAGTDKKQALAKALVEHSLEPPKRKSKTR